MSSLLSFTKLAFAAPRLAFGANTMASRAYATKKLFVANIAWGTQDDEVKDFFTQYGTITDMYVPKDLQGRTKGFAFVEFDEAEADKAIAEADGREFNGRELRVAVANPRETTRDGFRPRREEGEFRPRRENGGFRPRREEGEFRPRRESYNRSNDRE